MRQLESAHITEGDAGEMLLDGDDGDLLPQEREIFRAVGDDREDRGIALVAGAAVRQLVKLASHGLLSNRVSSAVARSRGRRQDTIPTCSWTYLRAPPPPAGPLVYSASTSSPMREASSFVLQRAATRSRTSYGCSP